MALSINGVYRDYKVNRLDMGGIGTQDTSIEIVANYIS
jgi:hypothetical protein